MPEIAWKRSCGAYLKVPEQISAGCWNDSIVSLSDALCRTRY
ncbi:hypothetical protein [Planomonospora parontospora]|nr:hypothetical protein [Planomonospora parontospora]